MTYQRRSEGLQLCSQCSGSLLALNDYGVCAKCWGKYDWKRRKRVAGEDMPPEPEPIVNEFRTTVHHPLPRWFWPRLVIVAGIVSAGTTFGVRWMGW